MFNYEKIPASFKALTLAAALGLGGCAVVSPVVGDNVSYGDAGAVETVTNEFGSTDLQMIAEKMTNSMLQSPALSGRPTVTLSPVMNKTSEYIDTNSIMEKIQTQLINSGRVRFVGSIAEMGGALDELQRQNQSGLYKSQGRANMGGMTAAKFRITGEINSIVKRSSKVKDVYYKMTLKLFNVEENTIEWADEMEIRKTSKR